MSAVRRPADPGDDPSMASAPPDLRLVPAALAAWATVLAGLGGGWVVSGGVSVVAGIVVATVLRGWAVGDPTADRRPRSPTRGGRGVPARGSGPRAGVLAAAACAAAAGLVVTAQGLLVAWHPLHAAAERGAAATLRVVLTDDPLPLRDDGYGSRPAGATRMLVRATLLAATAGEGRWRAGGRVLLLAPAEGWGGLLPGQQVTAEGLLAPAGRADLTVAVLRVRGAPAEVTAPPWWQTGAGALRDGLRAAATVLPDAEAGLLPGLAVGDTSAQIAEVERDFRAAGLSHLTAVSGANIAILAGAVLGLLRLLRAGPGWSAVLGTLAVAGFVLLARPSPSVLRAAAMAAVVLLALALGRARSAVPALAVAVLALLLADPALAVDPGFALSVLATAALVLLAPRWMAALRARGVPPGVAAALVVPLAAHLATAPVIAGLSGEVGLVTVAANLLAAPAVAPATILGVLAAVTSPLGGPVAQGCAWLAGPAVAWLVLVGDRAAALPGTAVPWPDGIVGGVLLALAVLMLLRVGRSPRGRPVLVAALLGLALVLVPTRVVPPGWPPAGWAMVACDVGQGDALVLATGRPGWAVLVDAGPDPGLVDACLDRLGVEGLALVVLSHLHADHLGGLPGALRGRPVAGVAVGPAREPRWALAEVARQAAAARVPLVELTAGRRLAWPALVVDILGPRHRPESVDPQDGTAVNDTSLVLRAESPVGSILLTGDIELAGQADLLAAGVLGRVDVLKMPHHGSRYTSVEFLAAVAPRAVLVSVGAGNRYRHPDSRLLDGLARSGATVRRTDQTGDVALVPDEAPGGLQVVARGDPLPPPRRRVRPERSAAVGQRRADGLARRGHRGGRADPPGDRVEGLEAVTGDQQHGLGVGIDPPGLDQLAGARDGHPARGLGEHALGPREQSDALDDLLVADVRHGAPGAAHRVEDVRAVGGVADGQRAGDRVRPHRRDDVVAVLERLRDGRAAGGLCAEDGVRGGVDEAEPAELLESLVDLGELRTGRHGYDDLPRQAPPELLGHLVAQGLGPLGVVRTDVDVDERPLLVLGGEFGGQPVHVVVVTLDGEQGTAVDGGGEDFGLLQRRRHEDDGVPACASGRGGHGVGEVAGGGAAQDGEAEFAGRSERDGDDAVLERVRRIAGVVLHPEVAQAQGRAEPIGLDQSGEAGLDVRVALHVRGHREQLPVAPDRLRAGLDRLAGDGTEVVGHFERAEALRTGELGGEGNLVAALATRQGARRAEVERAGGGGGAGGPRGGSECHRRSPHLPRGSRVGIGTWFAHADTCVAGCRGFFGPFPLPLWMSHMRLCDPGGHACDAGMTVTVRHVLRFQPVDVPAGASRVTPRVPGRRSVGEVRDHGDMVSPGPLRLVVGEEELLVERAVEAVLAEVRAAESGAELRRLRAAELTPGQLADVLSPSLFAEARVIVLLAVHEAGKDLAAAILAQATDVAEGIVLVVVHGGGARNKALVDALKAAGAAVTTCPQIRWPNERTAFVRAEVRRLGGRLARGADEVIVDAVGSDLRELAAAAAQLVADTGGTVDVAAVNRYHRGRAEVHGWDIADLALAGDRAGALEALRWAEALGVPAVVLADALASGLRTLARVGAAGRGDPNQIAGRLGMSSGKVRRAQAQVWGWHPEALAVAFAAAAEANADVKGAAADPGYALERAVLRICAARGDR
jgi:DNA internalization-related competence protein ComEC/Rec2/DNA polymerase III delta subunit